MFNAVRLKNIYLFIMYNLLSKNNKMNRKECLYKLLAPSVLFQDNKTVRLEQEEDWVGL